MSQETLHIGDQMMALHHRLETMCASGAALLLQVGQIWLMSGLGPTGTEVTELRIIQINVEKRVPDALGAWHKCLEVQFAHHQTTVFVPLITFLLAERELLK